MHYLNKKMLGLFKKNAEGGIPNILGILSPILKMQGINIDTIIPESASELRQLQDNNDIEIFAMLSVNNTGTGFAIGFYHETNDGYVCFHECAINNVNDALLTLAGIKNKFAELIKSKTDNGQILIEGTNKNAISGIDSSTNGDSDRDTNGA
jgi:hypothetical protein